MPPAAQDRPAEIGVQCPLFPGHKHFVRGLDSIRATTKGPPKSGRTKQGNHWLRLVLLEVATQRAEAAASARVKSANALVSA